MKMTARDFEIVRFILNMKFASVGDIHRKFFKLRSDGGISKSEWYARERLRELMSEGLITSVRYRFENKSYYIGTKLGYQLLDECYSLGQVTSKPIDRIDVRTFDHDVRVMQSRFLLEDHEKATEWQSDRQLKAIYEDYFNFRSFRDSAPDGVYKSLSGKLIAFEYEIAQKAKRRYRDKIRKYVDCIRFTGNVDQPKYDHVRFVCERESVRNAISQEAELYDEYFTIELADEFFRKPTIQPSTPTNAIMQ